MDWRFSDRAQARWTWMQSTEADAVRLGIAKPVGGDDILRFRCLGCGHCCDSRIEGYGQKLYPWETGRLTGLAQERGLPLPVMHRRVGLCAPVAKQGCAWYKSGEGCLVQGAKPLVCRLAPVGILVNPDKRVVAAAVKAKVRRPLNWHELCVGIERGGPKMTVREWCEANGIGEVLEAAG